MFGNRRRATQFNPGLGGATRWAFFGDPIVPVIYAAESEQSAVAESILHDVPLAGGRVFPEQYLDRVMARITCTRPLRFAEFAGGGLRHLGVRPANLTDTEPDTYHQTVLWAEAVREHTDCDGILWMSRHWNTDRAVMLFGDRVDESVLEQDPSFARAFSNPSDIEWLAAFCDSINVAFTPPA